MRSIRRRGVSIRTTQRGENRGAALGAVLLLCAAAEAQTTRFVDARSPQDGPGTDWSTAFHFPTDALAASAAGDEIRVAQGAYRPDQSSANPGGSNDRRATFAINAAIAVRGGYAGFGAVDPDQRDTVVHESSLTGDIGVAGNAADNSYHVVTGGSAAGAFILDGFTITAGNANGQIPLDSGGGVFLLSANPTIKDCIFRRNAGMVGGGLSVDDGHPIIESTEFIENTAGFGGGVNVDGDGLTVRRCRFERNAAVNYGGAIFGQPSFEANVVESVFLHNRADVAEGGAINALSDRPFRIVSCAFLGNSAGSRGGAISLAVVGEAPVVHCVFTGNRSEQGGAASIFHHFLASAEFVGCTFAGNSASQTAGGVLLLGGGGVVNFGNCVFWDNRSDDLPAQPDAIDIVGSVQADVHSSCIEDQDSEDDKIPFGGKANANIDDPPRFVDAEGPDGAPGTDDDDLRLASGSPCIDAGDSRRVPADRFDLDADTDTTERAPFDLDGKPRFVDDPESTDTGFGDPPVSARVVDMGAYEARARADFDDDGDVDVFDHRIFTDCLNGPGRSDPPPGCEASASKPADLDGDGDVDLRDFALLMAHFGA